MAEMSLEEANREAIRRIREAKESGIDWLDLGDLPIDIVPEEIGELHALKTLALGSYRPIPNETGGITASSRTKDTGARPRP